MRKPGYGSGRTDGGWKQTGSASGIGYAQPCAAVSGRVIRIGRCKERAREGIQSPRATAHLFARVTNGRIPPVSFLPQTSHMARVQTSSGVGDPAASTRLCSVVESGSVGDIRAIENVEPMSVDQGRRIAARRSTRCAPALAGVSERAGSA